MNIIKNVIKNDLTRIDLDLSNSDLGMGSFRRRGSLDQDNIGQLSRKILHEHFVEVFVSTHVREEEVEWEAREDSFHDLYGIKTI